MEGLRDPRGPTGLLAPTKRSLVQSATLTTFAIAAAVPPHGPIGMLTRGGPRTLGADERCPRLRSHGPRGGSGGIGSRLRDEPRLCWRRRSAATSGWVSSVFGTRSVRSCFGIASMPL